jgi:hypothetical protein
MLWDAQKRAGENLVEIADAEYRFAGLHDLIAQNRLPKG